MVSESGEGRGGKREGRVEPQVKEGQQSFQWGASPATPPWPLCWPHPSDSNQTQVCKKGGVRGPRPLREAQASFSSVKWAGWTRRLVRALPTLSTVLRLRPHSSHTRAHTHIRFFTSSQCQHSPNYLGSKVLCCSLCFSITLSICGIERILIIMIRWWYTTLQINHTSIKKQKRK